MGKHIMAGGGKIKIKNRKRGQAKMVVGEDKGFFIFRGDFHSVPKGKMGYFLRIFELISKNELAGGGKARASLRK